MPGFLVTIPTTVPGRTLVNKTDTMVVWAPDASAAKALAFASLHGDTNALWSGATVTQLAAATSWANPVIWSFNIQVLAPAGGTVVADVTVDSDATNDTIDEIAALLVTALNATTINAAAYVSASNVLTVAAAGDAIGDHTVICRAYPKGGDPVDVVGSFFGAITHQGSGGSALSVQLQADATEVPRHFAFATLRT